MILASPVFCDLFARNRSEQRPPSPAFAFTTIVIASSFCKCLRICSSLSPSFLLGFVLILQRLQLPSVAGFAKPFRN